MTKPFQLAAVMFLEISSHAAVTVVPAVPAEAAVAIASVHAAAMQNDLVRLRNLMTREFTWSLGYGADADADQAIAAWSTEPEVMTALQQVTGMRCGYVSEDVVQCPLDAGVAYRAGFTSTPAGWRMSYFLAGD